jgi:LysR family glycine cleavage system transcriptional activator
MNLLGVHMNALRAFEAAARLKSFSKAATELHVTHSTISHHVKGLESALGKPLFNRGHRQVELTQEAEKLSLVLQQSFKSITTELATLRKRQNITSLKVAVTPTFANKWLVPNLKHFRKAYPEIEVKVHPSLELMDLKQGNFNLAVRTGAGDWPGLRAQKAMPIHMSPVCAPDFFNKHQGKSILDMLEKSTLIHADVSEGVGIVSEWDEWASAAGLNALNTQTGLSFADPGIALQAAVDGLGIAMGYLELAQSDIDKGNLVQPFELTVPHPWSYYVVTPDDQEKDEVTSLFCNWLCHLTNGQRQTD